eukprot:scaffold116117_cov52-Attheya_sp.AAC.2
MEPDRKTKTDIDMDDVSRAYPRSSDLLEASGCAEHHGTKKPIQDDKKDTVAAVLHEEESKNSGSGKPAASTSLVAVSLFVGLGYS